MLYSKKFQLKENSTAGTSRSAVGCAHMETLDRNPNHHDIPLHIVIVPRIPSRLQDGMFNKTPNHVQPVILMTVYIVSINIRAVPCARERKRRISMIYAKKIKMQHSCNNSQTLTEIKSIYLSGVTQPGFYSKESIHNFLKEHPNTIQVDIFPYPYVVPATSSRGEKYVKSTPNKSGNDNLLSLPRE